MTLDTTIPQICGLLATAPSRQLNQRTLARKLGCSAASLGPALVAARRQGLVERAYQTIREAPSETTWKLRNLATPITLDTITAARAIAFAFGVQVNLRSADGGTERVYLTMDGDCCGTDYGSGQAACEALESAGYDTSNVY